MTWTRIGDSFNDRPDLLEVPRSARLLHIEAMVYCNRFLTNGLLPSGALRRITDAEDPESAAKLLVDAGLWLRTATGWQLDWSEQEDADDVRDRQEYRAATQKRYRERKMRCGRGDHSMCDPRYCKSAVTGNATSNKHDHETPSRPVPSRPEGTGTGSRGADQAGADAPPGHAAFNDWRRTNADELTDERVRGLIARAGDAQFAVVAEHLYRHAEGKRTSDGDALDPALWRSCVAYVLLEHLPELGDWTRAANDSTAATTTPTKEASSA